MYQVGACYSRRRRRLKRFRRVNLNGARTNEKFGIIIKLIPAVVLLCTIIPSNDCLCIKRDDKEAKWISEWIFKTCTETGNDIEPQMEPSSVCYVPRESPLSCEGVHNAVKCQQAFTTFVDYPLSPLSPLKETNFAFDVQSNRLCYQPQIEPSSSNLSFLGYNLWVKLVMTGNLYLNTAQLGVIFRSGVENRTILESTFACVKIQTNVTYSNVSFFVFSGMSMPSQIFHDPTEQEDLYSLASLRKVSFDDVTYLKDYRNVSTPIFRLKEELCELPLSSESKILRNLIGLNLICLTAIAVMTLLIVVAWRLIEKQQKRRIPRSLHQATSVDVELSGDLSDPTHVICYQIPNLGATSSVAVDTETAAPKATPDSENPLLPSSVAAGVERGQVSARISWSPPIFQVFETESGV